MGKIELVRYAWEPSEVRDDKGIVLEGVEPSGYHVQLCKPQLACTWQHHITLGTPTVLIVFDKPTGELDDPSPRAIRVQGFHTPTGSVSEWSQLTLTGMPVIDLPSPGGVTMLLIGAAVLAVLGKRRKIR